MAAQRGRKTNEVVSNVLGIKDYLQCPEGHSFEFQEIWKRVVRDYPAEHFRVSDTELMEQYVDAEMQRKSVAQMLTEEGYVVDTPQGTKPNPLVSVQTQLASQVRACARMLRLGPNSRIQASQVPKSPARQPAPSAPVESGKRVVRLAGVESLD